MQLIIVKNKEIVSGIWQMDMTGNFLPQVRRSFINIRVERTGTCVTTANQHEVEVNLNSRC